MHCVFQTFGVLTERSTTGESPPPSPHWMGGEGNLKALAGPVDTRTKDHDVVTPHHKAIAMGAEQGAFGWRKGKRPAEGGRARPYCVRARSLCPGSRSGVHFNALR